MANSISCRGCKYADITREAHYYKGQSFANVAYTLTIWCSKKEQVIKYPYEQCKQKTPTLQWS